MKKLVTLSAVALAGATLGVGSTFGWWAEEPKPQPDPSAQIAQESKIVVISPVEADNDSGGAQFEIIGELQTQQPKTVTITLDPDNSEKIEKLAKEIEQEAKQLDEQGQKAEAEARRKLARRLRDAISTQKLQIHNGDSTVKAKRLEFKAPNQFDSPKQSTSQLQMINALEGEMRRLQDALERADHPAAKEKLQTAIRNLKKELQNLQRVSIEEGKPKSKRSATESPERPEARNTKLLAEPNELLIEKLLSASAKLRAQGDKVQARAILEQAEELQRGSVPIGAFSERHSPVAVPEIKGQDRNDPETPADRKVEQKTDQSPVHFGREVSLWLEVGNSRPLNFERLEKKLAILFPNSKVRLLNAGPEMINIRGVARDREEADTIQNIIRGEIISQRNHPESGETRGHEEHHPHAGPHPGDVHGMLRALHHEISALREEVRDLRNLLRHERHPELGELKHKGQEIAKGKAKNRDDANTLDDEWMRQVGKGKGKVRTRDDDDDKPHLMRNYPPDYRPQGKAKNRDDDDDKGRIKNRDSDDAVGKGKAKSRDDDDDGKGKAQNRDDDDAVEKGKAKERRDDRESDDDKAKGEQDD